MLNYQRVTIIMEHNYGTIMGYPMPDEGEDP
jgi:hypothetical protein